MDKAARPAVPRLQLPHPAADFYLATDLEGLQLTTCRSELEDFALPTSFRTSRGKQEAMEKIPGQLERLTGLIESVMDNLKESGESRGSSCQLTLGEAWEQTERERADMRLEEVWAVAEYYRRESQDRAEELTCVVQKLALAVEVSETEHDLTPALAHRLEALVGKAHTLGLNCPFVPSSALAKAQEQLKAQEAVQTILINELRQLKHHTENLTNQRLNSLSGNWAIELPAFCKNLLSLISSLSLHKSSLVSQHQDIGKVTCSAEDLQQVLERVGTILEDCEQSGGCKEFGIQLGQLGVTIVVESQELPELPRNLSQKVSEGIACKGSMTDRVREAPRAAIDSLAYIHQLEERIVDLQSTIQGREDPSSHSESDSMAAELETKLEEAMYKLTLANQQITRLKQGKYSQDEDRVTQNYKLKLAETRAREDELREMSTKLALEREHLRLKVREFERERDGFMADHEAAMQELTAAFQELHKDSCPGSTQTDDCEPDKAQLIDSQKVVRKESGQWINLGSSKKAAQQLHRLYTELERGLEPEHLPDFRKRLFQVKVRLEGLSADSEEAETGSVFTLSEDEGSGRTWSPTRGPSPHFSVSGIEQREDCTADVKLKDEQIEALRLEIAEKDRKMQEMIEDNAKLREEKLIYLRKSEEMEQLKHTLQSYLSIRTTESQEMEKFRSDLAQQQASLEEDKAAFRQKRTLLSDKIALINERQKKLQSKEKLLTEKETLLLLQEKKTDLHKQAVDQLWKENDEKRHELFKCQRVIDDEWKVLMEETRQFEALKVGDKRVRAELETQRKEVQDRTAHVREEEDRVRSLLLKAAKDRETVEREKGKVREERRVLSEERNRLVKAKSALRELLSRCQPQGNERKQETAAIVKGRRSEGEQDRVLEAVLPGLDSLLADCEEAADRL